MSRKKSMLWIVLAVVLVLEFAVHGILTQQMKDSHSRRPSLTVTSCRMTGDELTAEVKNTSARQYRGAPMLYLSGAPSQNSAHMQMDFAGYYDEMNRAGTQDYDMATVVPPGQTITLTCTMTEQQKLEWEAVTSQNGQGYAFVAPDFRQSEEEVTFCLVAQE